MGERPYSLLDVFTDTPLEGNQLAVVHDADGMADAVMRALALETKLSETTFVQSADAAGADYRNRIWTTGGEIPFGGHPSLGTAFAIARARGEREVSYVQQTGAGLQPVDVEVDGDRGRASMLQEPASFGEEVDPAVALPAAGLEPGDVHPDLPPQFVSTGVPQLVVPIARAEALARVRPDPAALEALLGAAGAVVLYVALCDPETATARARSVSHTVHGGEDPATGGAAGPLCAYLAQRTGAEAVTISQGVEMGRPSRLEARMEGDRARVGGGVVAVADGTLLV